jgi:hypothetical protein
MSVQYIRVNKSSSIDGRCIIPLLNLAFPVGGVVPNTSEMSWILRMPQRTVSSQIRVKFTMCNGPTNALVCNKTLIQMSHIKTLKITPTCFDHQMIIIRELFDPG